MTTIMARLLVVPSFRRSNHSSNTKRSKARNPTSKGSLWLRVTLVVIFSLVLLLPFVYLQFQLIRAPDDVLLRHDTMWEDRLHEFRQQQPITQHHHIPQRKYDGHPHGASQSPRRVLTAYLESPSTIISSYYYNMTTNSNASSTIPRFSRHTTAGNLTKLEFPHSRSWCDWGTDDHNILPDLPIDDFPTQDPFLPWIHDYFVSEDAQYIRFVGQNKRRCDTGEQHQNTMAFWEPQVTLFQSIPVVVVDDKKTVRLATSLEEATHPATRFICRFVHPDTNETMTTFSIFKFDYEYITWRKLRRPMLDRNKGGKDTAMFWLSTLLFSCPIPEKWQSLLLPVESQGKEGRSLSRLPATLYLDLVPIRTPVRQDQSLLTANHTGPEEYAKLQAQGLDYPLNEVFGPHQFLPPVEDSGRWANLPICPRPPQEQQLRGGRLPPKAKSTTSTTTKDVGDRQYQQHGEDYNAADDSSISSKPTNSPSPPPFQFVACTWTAASYTRRGDVMRVSDSAARLREWIIFHLMVGVEHVYIYDNTEVGNNNNTTTSSSTAPTARSELWQVAQEFPKEQVTYHAWPCKICNNNRPAHSNPGERSSQYAAEASCRERYGPLTSWMTFLDVDEYLVPMKAADDADAEEKQPYDWRPILSELKAKDVPILQFLSSRARPRVDRMEELEDQSMCQDPTGQKNGKFPNTDRCIVGPQRGGDTFLNVYNCEYIRPPKPMRFARARKQIYQPSYVWSHFVHYSTVTADYAETYSEFQQKAHKDGSGGNEFLTSAHGSTWEKRYPDVFANEVTTGTLIHARSVMAHETRRRSAECTVGSKVACMVGHVCEDSVEFIDEKHTQNIFHNSDGSYCNCWENPVVAQTLAPQLDSRLQKHKSRKRSIG